MQNRFIQIYGPSGTWVRAWRSSVGTGPQTIRLYRTSTSAFWSYLDYIAADGVRSVFIRYTSDGPLDTIPARIPLVPPFKGALCRVANGGIAFYGVPFGPAAFAVPLGDGRQAVALNSDYRIVVLGRARGDTALVIEREQSPAIVSDDEWEAEMVKFRTWRRQLAQPDCLRDVIERPETKPPLGWMVTDDEGRLWVEVVVAGGRRYDVYDPAGTLHVSVTGLPPTGGIDPSIVAGFRSVM